MYRGIVIIPKIFLTQAETIDRQHFIRQTAEAGIELILLRQNTSIDDLTECLDEILKVRHYLPSFTIFNYP